MLLVQMYKHQHAFFPDFKLFRKVGTTAVFRVLMVTLAAWYRLAVEVADENYLSVLFYQAWDTTLVVYWLPLQQDKIFINICEIIIWLLNDLKVQ